MEGNPPWYAYQFNTIYYNPQITYFPAVDGLGNRMTSFGSPWTSVKVNAFVGSSTINLVSGYPEVVCCKNSNDSPTDTNNCRRNGIDTGNPFAYDSTSTNGYPERHVERLVPLFDGARRQSVLLRPVAREHCSDVALTTCTLSATPTRTLSFPAIARFCRNALMRIAMRGDGSTAASRAARNRRPPSTSTRRYGQFERFNMVSMPYGDLQQPPNRTDCASAPTCTYAEEMTNFANWYPYYSTRMQMMKTAVGYAFLRTRRALSRRFHHDQPRLTGQLRTSTRRSTRLPATHRTTWYSKLYSINPADSTPLREALSRVGRSLRWYQDRDQLRHESGPGPVLLPGQCRDPEHATATGTAMAATSLTAAQWGIPTTSTAATRRAPPARTTAGWAQAGRWPDVAMYYYSTDLRANGSTGALGTDVAENNVPTTTRDMNSGQHMLTFTLGLGLGGFMRYLPNYEAATFGDFYKIRTGNTGCALRTRATRSATGRCLPTTTTTHLEQTRRPVARGGERARPLFQREGPERAANRAYQCPCRDQRRHRRRGVLGDQHAEPDADRQPHLQLDLPHRQLGRRDGGAAGRSRDRQRRIGDRMVGPRSPERQDLGRDRHTDDLYRQRRRAGAVRLDIDGRRDARSLRQQVRVALAMPNPDSGRARNRRQRGEPRQLPARTAPTRIGLPRPRIRARRSRGFAAGVCPRPATQLR